MTPTASLATDYKSVARQFYLNNILTVIFTDLTNNINTSIINSIIGLLFTM